MLLCQEKWSSFSLFFSPVLYMSEYLPSVTDRFSLQYCSLTSCFECLRSMTVFCISRTLQEAEEHTRKKTPVSDPSEIEELRNDLDAGHEKSDILSTQEEMFPENHATGNNK